MAAFALAQVRPPAPAAADAAARVAEAERLIARLQALLKAQDRAGLEAELGKVGPAHNALDDEAVRARLHRVVGDVLAHEALGSTRLQAADALAECHDERVWSQLKRVFPAPEVETGLPYGTYDICAYRPSGNRRNTATDVPVQTTTTDTARTIYTGSSATGRASGACP